MSDVKFIFVRDCNNFPVGCFAYAEIAENVIEFGYSIFFLGGKDKFDRALGRLIAQKRLEKKPCNIYDSSLSSDSLVVEMLRNSCKPFARHQWAKNSLGRRRNLGHRFKDACKRTADKLAECIERKTKAA